METDTTGRVLVEAMLESLKDLWALEQGLIKPDQVRRIIVPDALVDTGATMLSLPTRMIRQLGLSKSWTRQVTTSRGTSNADVYSSVKLTIKGRECPMDVLEVPDDVPVLIGQIPLEYLDFVVDPQSRSLIGNPAHGGEQMYEMY
ncbi:MAG: retropepsin-like aspartic protease [Thermoguttaceae bacterium]|jgi:predicted aspartyl protease